MTQDRVDPHILQGSAQANATGRISSDIRRWFAGRGPASLLSRIRIPTLIEQGTVDTLFTLQEGIDNYQVLRANHVPVAMLWYCGGHGTCFTAPGAQNLPGIAAIAWMNRWVKREPQVTTGPAVTVIDQRGIRYAASGYPVPSGSPLTATGHGRLVLTASGGAGPVLAEPPGATDPLGGLALPFTPAEARNAVNVRVQARQRAALVVGAPLVTLRYRGTAAAGVRPTRVFAQLVDDSTHWVLGNQITPIDLTLDGKTHTTHARMEVVTQWMAARHSTTLQLVATTVAYAAPRLGGSVSFERITIALPTTRPGALAKIGPGRAK